MRSRIKDDSQLQLKRCYYFGKNYFCPFLFGFITWLKKQLDIIGSQKVYFFARDGYMMKRAFDILYPDYESQYVYFSRKSLRQALLYKCNTYQESLEYLTDERYISFGKVLRYYGFNKEETKYFERETRISVDEEYVLNQLKDNKKICEFYNRNKAIIKEKSIKQSRLLKEYLKQIQFAGLCPIVDIGWHGSMQYYLNKYVNINGIEADIKGFYIGINTKYYTQNDAKGYIFNGEKDSLRKKVLCFLGGYEKLFQSQEGSTIGYYSDGKRILPLLDKYEYSHDNEIQEMISLWQKGAERGLSHQKQLKYRDKNKLIEPLIHFGMNPPNWGLKMFKNFYIDDGGKQYFLAQKMLMSFKPEELKHSLSNSVWKTGFMKSLMKIPFPYYILYKVLRK